MSDQRKVLAGDVGGTKTLLGLYEPRPTRPEPTLVTRFATERYRTVGDIIAEFLDAAGEDTVVGAACVGVAGPVSGTTARLTNAPVTIDAEAISSRFSIPSVRLVNDLVATAYAAPALLEDERSSLQTGRQISDGNAALIAPGTGLGEALLHRVDGRLVPSPSEGGHADFAPRTPREVELLEFLTLRFGRVSYERVLSGPGLTNLHLFTHQHRLCDADVGAAEAEEAPPRITAAALSHRCASCVEALDLFVAVLGAEAGNLALRSMATSGLFVGGGIAPKILAALSGHAFLQPFRLKPPMEALVADVPVWVILRHDTALLGAAIAAGLLMR